MSSNRCVGKGKGEGGGGQGTFGVDSAVGKVNSGQTACDDPGHRLAVSINMFYNKAASPVDTSYSAAWRIVNHMMYLS